MSRITISIVTPCLNSERHLEEAIKSATSQQGDFTLEYIVVDGGSTDKTLEVIKANEEKISRWISEQDAGMYDGILKGFSLCSGEIMGWLNSDDIYFPGALNCIAKIFSSLPEVQWVSTLTPTAIDAAGDILRVGKIAGFSRQAFLDGVYVGFEGLGDALSTEFIQQESTFWRRSLWEKVGPEVMRPYRLAGDFALWCAFIDFSSLCGLESPLGAFRVHRGQLSSGRAEYLREAKQALEALRARNGYAQREANGECGTYKGHYVKKVSPDAVSSQWTTLVQDFVVLPHSSGNMKELVRDRRIF